MDTALTRKYNVPGPRYTSYPTVPYWEEEDFSTSTYIDRLKKTFDASNDKDGISLYIHLPFCSNMCTYCGCNVRFTQNHKFEQPYIERLLKEWNMYLDALQEVPKISQIHLGGGTPTFFSPENLKYLIDNILHGAILMPTAELSFEAHPGSTTDEHLETLYGLGFRRLSFGIQDFDPKVQEIINRIQPLEMVEPVVAKARELGYESINFDLIYGLPLQTTETVRKTIEMVQELQPDRIAFYSYAHVPWIKGMQRKFTEDDLPQGEEKRALYELGKQLFEESGYKEIGMDHFALTSDSLYQAYSAKNLHRNFMGYTTQSSQMMIGLGVSSIGDSWTAFGQNEKILRKYEKAIDEGRFPLMRGHLLNEEDGIIRNLILDLMCHFSAEWDVNDPKYNLINGWIAELNEMVHDGLVTVEPGRIEVLEEGRPFVRNICMVLDARLRRRKPENRIFSQTV